MRDSALEVSFVRVAVREDNLAPALTATILESALVHFAICALKLAFSGWLSIDKVTLKRAVVGEGDFAATDALSSLIQASVGGATRVRLGALSMRQAFFPLAIISSSACLLNLALAVALSSLELALVLVARGGLFFAPAFWDSLLPVAVVLLTIFHGHLAFAIAHAICERSDVHVAVGKFESTRAVGASVLLLSCVDIARGSPHFLW